MNEKNKLTGERTREEKLAAARMPMQRYRERKYALVQTEVIVRDEMKNKQKQNEDKNMFIEQIERRNLERERSRRYRERKRLETVNHLFHDAQFHGSHANPLENDNDEYRAKLQANRTSETYRSWKCDSSAHMQFHKQFVHNRFGHACKICDRLWFKNDLKILNYESMKFLKIFISNIGEEPIAVCASCRASIRSHSVPNMAVQNGFKYPAIPDNLLNHPLDLVTERLVSPRIPFMQLRRIQHFHGYGICGQVINIPLEVDTVSNKLPNMNDDCIYVHVKKQTIKEWLQYLVNTPLYRAYNITMDDMFFHIERGEVPPNVHIGIDVGNWNDDSNGNVDNLNENIPIEKSLPAQHTVIWNDDLYLRIVPVKNNLPISLLYDKHAEELAFPSIYLGEFREFAGAIQITPFMMASSELRRSDRRGVTPHHLLYMALKIMRLRVKDSLALAVKNVEKKNTITDEKIQSENIHNYIESNLTFLSSIPNSTWRWLERKKDLFAMIRQLGQPTVFFTISANEIGWLDLLQLLYQLNTRNHITKNEVSQLHFMVKRTLINEDAVTCVIYFNKLVNVIMNILKSKKCSPFRKYRIAHYYKRIEFQQKGSPHAHILAWLDNSPSDALNNDYEKAIELIDSLISVSAAEASGNIRLQTHKHTFACYKEITADKAQKCRFDAPFMPCKKTMILTPMNSTEKKFNSYKKRYDEVRIRLENEDFVDMDDFYNRNAIDSDEDYRDIIRAGINKPKVFVKREPFEKWHNNFNPFILNIAQSNTDFQFITDELSCAAYVAEYVNKTNRGVKHLQTKIIETMNKHPEYNIIDVTKHISVNILNHTEMTSQEAAWYLLREPMAKSSITIEHIPTVWPTERQLIRKTMKELGELDDDRMWKENWFDKYEKRPEYLEEITLAQFVCNYAANRKGEYVEKRESKVIRYQNYDIETNLTEYKREMVTLHLPFRNEEEEILADMKFITLYDYHEDIILQRRKEFESNIDINKIIQRLGKSLLEEVYEPIENPAWYLSWDTSAVALCAKGPSKIVS